MVTGVNHVTFAVLDLELSVGFYRDVLGMQLVARWDRGAYFLAGDCWIALNLDERTQTEPAPESSHVAFSVSEKEIGPLSDRILRAGGAEWQPTCDASSFYFTDPDGHKLELHAGSLADRMSEFERDPPAGWLVGER